MNKLLIAFLIVSSCLTKVFGQQISIAGNVSDSVEKKGLSNTVVYILRAKDSMLLHFSRCDKEGNFKLTVTAPDIVLLVASYPGYPEYVEKLPLSDTLHVGMIKIFLTTRIRLLEEVIVKHAISAIKVNGDTTEYKADAFHLLPNASVEELLKKLPGIQVHKNGQITAQGEKVQRILVDGEEFFSEDPVLVSRNLRADMVDKVQVFNKKSEMATFTGVDDGQRSQTINLVLKENKKTGLFGKVEGSTGNGGYYNSSGMLNVFKGKEKFAVYGIVSNTAETGLSASDQSVYSDELNTVTNNENSGAIDSWSGYYNGSGYPLAQSGGLHYNNKWNQDKQSVNGNYTINNLRLYGSNTISADYLLPDTLYHVNSNQHYDNSILRNTVSGMYEMELSSLASIKLTLQGTNARKNTSNVFQAESLSAKGLPVNRSERTMTTAGVYNSFNGNILWKQKFKKPRRTIMLDVTAGTARNSSNGNLFAQNHFYKNDSANAEIIEITDQFKSSLYNSFHIISKTIYTEPVSPVSFITLNHEIAVNNSASDQISFNRSINGNHDVIDSATSNNYKLNILSQKGGLGYVLTKQRYYFIAGIDVSLTDLGQVNKWSDHSMTKRFVNFMHNTMFSYGFTGQRRMTFSSKTSVNAPSLEQIQPSRNNNDPLNLVIGNVNLKPSVVNDFSLRYSDFKSKTERNWITWVNARFLKDAISSNDYMDTFGRRIYQHINVNGEYSLGAHTEYTVKWIKPAIYVELEGNFSMDRFVNIISGMENVTDSKTYAMGLSLEKSKEKKYEISIGAYFNYYVSGSSVQKNIPVNYWSYNIHPDIKVFLPFRMYISSDCNFKVNQKNTFFDVNKVVIWNGNIGKKMLSNEALLIKLSGIDILNNNIGITRAVNTNYIIQNSFSTIQRYFMVSVIWNFNRNK